jgi:hypothetical protein
MHELDDAALELRLRRTLSERLDPLPLDLTAEALVQRRVVRDKARRRRRIVLGLGLAAALILPSGWLAAGAPLPSAIDAVVRVEPSSTPRPTSPPSDPPSAETSDPEGPPTARPVPNPGVVSLDTPAAGDTGRGTLLALQTLASSRLAVPVSFWLDQFGGPSSHDTTGASDFCPAVVTDRSIVLGWLMGCVGELQILVPAAIACGTADRHPTAEALAAAILARPGLDAHDLGPVGSSDVVPSGLLRGVDGGRVVDIPGTARAFVPADANPDACLIVSDHPDIEVRGDLAARLLLLDVGDELVIIRMAPGGYDGQSGAEAHSRGYGVGADDDGALYRVMLERMHELSFGASAARP